MQALWQTFWSDDAGATMVEYGLMVALIAVAAAVGASAFGIGVRDQLFIMAASVAAAA